MDTVTRRCGRCKQTKPLSEFSKDKECKGGISHRCKECKNQIMRDWRQKHYDEFIQKRKDKYHADNGKQHRDREIARRKREPLLVLAQVRYQGLRAGAKKRGVPFDPCHLTVEYILSLLSEQKTCECCGRPLAITFVGDGEHHTKDDVPTIDRLEPRLGYVAGNTAMICWRCNCLKRDATAAELEMIAAWMRSRGLE